MAQQPRKELLIETASELFNRDGLHNTGIDTIMKVSGVSKTTMYKYFPSKESLILEVLKRRHEYIKDMMVDAIMLFTYKNPELPKYMGLSAILMAVNSWIKSENFYGCNFINASAEYSQKDAPIHQYSAQHKKKVRDIITELLEEEYPGIAHILAQQILLIIDGAIISAHVKNEHNSIANAKIIIEALLRETLSGCEL